MNTNTELRRKSKPENCDTLFKVFYMRFLQGNYFRKVLIFLVCIEEVNDYVKYNNTKYDRIKK